MSEKIPPTGVTQCGGHRLFESGNVDLLLGQKPHISLRRKGCVAAAGAGLSRQAGIMRCCLRFVKRNEILSEKVSHFGGSWWIRTTEALRSRFTVCPHWPLGKAPLFNYAFGVSLTARLLQQRPLRKASPFYKKIILFRSNNNVFQKKRYSTSLPVKLPLLFSVLQGIIVTLSTCLSSSAGQSTRLLSGRLFDSFEQ